MKPIKLQTLHLYGHLEELAAFTSTYKGWELYQQLRDWQRCIRRYLA